MEIGDLTRETQRCSFSIASKSCNTRAQIVSRRGFENYVGQRLLFKPRLLTQADLDIVRWVGGLPPTHTLPPNTVTSWSGRGDY